jgi:hypothetical protein
MKVDDNVFPKVIVSEVTAPATPAAATVVVYAKADGLLYSKDDAGVETLVSGGAGGGGGSSLTVQDEGSSLATAATTINFTGAGVTASGTGATKTVTIPGGGGLTAAYLGYNTIGASSESVTGLNMYCKSITTSGAVEAVSVSFYGHQNGTDNVTGFLAGIWDDNSGVVGHLLAAGGLPTTSVYLHDVAGSAGTDRWFHFPVSYPLAASTTYWMGFLRDNSGSHAIFYDTSGSDRTISTGGGYWLADGARYTQTNSTKKYSIRLRVIS